MERRRMSIVAAGLGAVLALATPVRAGVVILTESDDPRDGAPGAKTTGGEEQRIQGRLLVQGDDVRMEGAHSDRGSKAKSTILFRGGTETFIVLDEEQRSYFEITRADAKRLGAALEEARSRMQAQLGKMSPEQRAMVERAMGNLTGASTSASKPEPVKAVATGATDEVRGRSCREYDLVRGTKKIGGACVASWSALGLAPDDLQGLRKLAAFQREMLEQVSWLADAAAGSDAFAMMDEVGGFPVRVRTEQNGEPVVMQVIGIERQEIDPKTFAIPPGYTKRAAEG